MERKLASVQVIGNIFETPGFDRLEMAQVLGWKALVKKDEFKVGEKVIYVEYDSLLPENVPAFEFMAQRKFRVKTIKLNARIFNEDGKEINRIPYLSQGLIFPTSILSEVAGFTIQTIDALEVGSDVTEALGIIKYEIVQSNSGGKNAFKEPRNWPVFIPKTDEMRLQSFPDVLDELYALDCGYYGTIKADGSSATYYVKCNEFDELHFGICSRNIETKLPAHQDDWDCSNNYIYIAKQYQLKHKLKHFFETCGKKEYAIHGEIAGPGMNGSGAYKNPMGFKELTFQVFSIFNITDQVYVSLADVYTFCEFYDLPMVKILFDMEVEKKTLEEWIEYATTLTYENKNPAEGVVIRPMVESFSKTLRGRLSFKVINNNYLLKEK